MQSGGLHIFDRLMTMVTDVPQNVLAGTEKIIVDSGVIVVPSDMTVTIKALRNNGTFIETLITGFTNNKYSLAGLFAQQIEITKTAGAGTILYVAYGQGAQLSPSSVITVGGNVSVVNTPPLVTYNSTPLVKANGETGTLQGDSALRVFMREAFAAKYENNPLSVAQMLLLPTAAPDGSWNLFKNLGANNTLNMKGSGGNINSFYCRSRSAAVLYFQLFITATVPTNGAIPDFSFMIDIGKSITFGNDFFGLGGVWGALGWAFAISTTENSLTLGTASEQTTFVTIK